MSAEQVCSAARPRRGSVGARASKYGWPDEGRDFSGGLQHSQNRCGAAKEVEPAVGTAEVARRSWALEPAHRAVAAFNTAMILLQSVVEILAVAMPNTGAQDRPDRAGITVMPIRGDPIGRDAGDHRGRLEERLRGGHVAVLAEQHVDQRARAIDGTIEIT